MNKAIIAVVAVVLIAAGGALALMSGKSDDTAKEPSSSTTAPESTANTTESATEGSNEAAKEDTITYNNDGFSPSSLSAKAGSQVTVKNASSRSLQFDSDPHPQHTDNPELNIGIIAPGDSKSFTVTTTGSHGFHNHLNASDTGTLTVQ